MEKKLGMGSISLALFILAVLWSVSIKSLDNFSLGDIVLNAVGLQAWSNDTSGKHYTVFTALYF